MELVRDDDVAGDVCWPVVDFPFPLLDDVTELDEVLFDLRAGVVVPVFLGDMMIDLFV